MSRVRVGELGLPPRRYTATIDSAQLEFLGVVAEPHAREFEIRATKDGDVVEGLDFLLVSAPAANSGCPQDGGTAEVSCGLKARGEVPPVEGTTCAGTGGGPYGADIRRSRDYDCRSADPAGSRTMSRLR